MLQSYHIELDTAPDKSSSVINPIGLFILTYDSQYNASSEIIPNWKLRNYELL